MRFERITSPAHPMYERALALYQISFPSHEQRQLPSQEKILSDTAYHFTLIYDGEAFVGIILFWETEDFLYVEHFCIVPELRSRGYGRMALDHLAGKGNLILLEIDPPVDDIALRRKGFYERSGFVENPYPHVHPPYHRENKGHELTIMSCPRPVHSFECRKFQEYLAAYVMAGAF